MRGVGFAIMLICGSQIVAFFMGYGKSHMVGTIFAFIFCLYGLYLFISSFKSRAYNMDYEFKDDGFIVHTKYSDKNYAYSEITDVNLIIPSNEILYCIIQIYVGKKQFVLPFSLKKVAAEQLYSFLCEKTGIKPFNDLSEDEETTPEENTNDVTEDVE